jgi:hypothetical protein
MTLPQAVAAGTEPSRRDTLSPLQKQKSATCSSNREERLCATSRCGSVASLGKNPPPPFRGSFPLLILPPPPIGWLLKNPSTTAAPTESSDCAPTATRQSYTAFHWVSRVLSPILYLSVCIRSECLRPLLALGLRCVVSIARDSVPCSQLPGKSKWKNAESAASSTNLIRAFWIRLLLTMMAVLEID